MFRHNYFQHLFSNFQCIVHTLLFFTIIPLIDSRNARGIKKLIRKFLKFFIKDYDGFLAPDSLKPISWYFKIFLKLKKFFSFRLLGVWRSEHDGKAVKNLKKIFKKLF